MTHDHKPSTDLTLVRLDAAIERLTAATTALEERVAELERRQGTDPSETDNA